MGIVGAVFANSNRGAALGIVSSSVYLGLSCGPMIGGWLTQEWGWQAVFWAPVPVVVLALLLILSFVKGEWKAVEPEPMDQLSSILFAAWVSAFFFALSDIEGRVNQFSLLLGIGLFYCFLKRQQTSAYPLIDLSAFKTNRTFSRSLLSSFLMYSANFPIVFLMSLYLQYVHELSPLEAGEFVLIQTFIMMLLAPLSGRLSDRYEPRYLATLGCISFGVGLGVLWELDKGTSLLSVFMGLVFLGIGFGLFSSPNNHAIISSANKEELSAASALLGLSRNLGNLISTAIVMMLMSISLGSEPIHEQNLDQLLWVVNLTLVLTLLSVLGAIYCSFTRGELHKTSLES